MHQLVFEQRIFWRSREAAVFVFIFPILLYVLLSSVYSDEIDGVPPRPTSFSPGSSATARRTPPSEGSRSSSSADARPDSSSGFAPRRFRPRPTSPPSCSRPSSSLRSRPSRRRPRQAVFDASAPANSLGFAGAVVLGVACFAGLGVGAASLIRSAEGVSAVVNVVLLPMAFLSGSFGPTDDYPAFLDAIADVLPLTYFLDIVDAVYLDGDSLFSDPKALAVVAAWGVAGLVIALTRFSWMPRERERCDCHPKVTVTQSFARYRFESSDR